MNLEQFVLKVGQYYLALNTLEAIVLSSECMS